MQVVGAIGKSGKAGEIDGSRREDDIAIALANGGSLRAYTCTCFLSLLLLTSSLSSSAETLGLETSLALPALFDFLKSYTCFCHVYSRVTREGGAGNSRVREHLRVRAYKLACHSLARVTLPVICTVSQKLNMLSSSNLELSLFLMSTKSYVSDNQRYSPKVSGFWKAPITHYV